MENGFASTAPFGIDRLAITRNMDTTSLATTFPFTSAELSSDEGILYGINPQNDSFIIFDRFSLENSNMTIFATSGAGKSTSYNDPVLFDNGSGPKLEKIGKLIENLMQKNKITQLDQESEGVINPNLKIFSFDKNLKTKWSDVKIAARKLSPNDMYQIITQSGREITITGDHCLVALKNGKVVTIKGKAAKIGNYLPVPRLIENLEVKNNFSQELLTLLGLITSEGHTRKEFVSIYNTDKFVLKKIEKCALKLGFYVSPISKDKKIRGYYLRPADKARILIKKFGGFGSSKEKRVPSIIFSLPNSEIAQYLKAYFEGDGGCEDHEITATTKSKNLASDLSYLLLRFGIIARIKTRKKAATNTVAKTKRKYYRVSISGQDNIKKFIDNIGFLTEEKNTKAQKLLKAEKQMDCLLLIP
ncbi:hypothetical protein HYS03_00395 [Candidatus Woesebacteria bacterium]|nr:hypothetical protein [Candidatus Woesebacteria bacterium]